jgi:RHS repeat-associated protein
MGMPGRSFKAGTGYRLGYNGQEKSDDVTVGNYTAEFWEYDSRTGRRWNTDPVILAGESPYLVNGGNPIYYTDPLGDFKTKFGAQWNKFWNGGRSVGKNKYDEWYVLRDITGREGKKGSGNVNDEIIVGTERYFGQGRRYYTAAGESMARDEEIKQDIFLKGDKSMYQIYDSEEAAGNAALSYTGVWLLTPFLKSGTIAANSTKVVPSTKPILLLESQGVRLLRIAEIAENSKLKDLISRLWRPGAKFGDGSTGAMIKLEKAEGIVTSASGSHIQKAEEAIGTARKLLNGNFGTLSEADRKVVFEIIENLTNGTGLKF